MSCKILHVGRTEQLQDHAEELMQHFQKYASPVMMGKLSLCELSSSNSIQITAVNLSRKKLSCSVLTIIIEITLDMIRTIFIDLLKCFLTAQCQDSIQKYDSNVHVIIQV